MTGIASLQNFGIFVFRVSYDPFCASRQDARLLVIDADICHNEARRTGNGHEALCGSEGYRQTIRCRNTGQVLFQLLKRSVLLVSNESCGAGLSWAEDVKYQKPSVNIDPKVLRFRAMREFLCQLALLQGKNKHIVVLFVAKIPWSPVWLALVDLVGRQQMLATLVA